VSGYDPRLHAAIAAAERRHFWFRARNRMLLTLLAPLGGRLPSRARVLEVGCGTGNTLRVLEQACPQACLVGMDLFAEGLHHARGETRAHLLRADAGAPPFRTRFHLIALFDVLEHVERDEETLAGLRDLLEPGGHLVLTVPARRALWSAVDVAAHHVRRYERDELIARLTGTGYDVRYVTPFMMATYPLLWLTRKRRPASVTPTAAAQAELRVPATVNALLDVSLRPERWIVSAGRSLPFGSSLAAIAARS